MGLFNETEEEKNFKKLIKGIKYSNLSEEWKTYLVDFVRGISEGTKHNDFFNQDILTRIILKVVEVAENDDNLDPAEEMQKVRNIIKLMLPEGEKTEDFTSVMEMIINNFLGDTGILANNLYNKSFYALFQNRYDYLYLINLIRQDDQLVEYADRIFKYGVDVSPYCGNQQVLKNEILAFMNGLVDELYDYDGYYDRMLSEAKKRCGIYPIDEKTLSLISDEAEKAQALIEKLKSIQKKIDAYGETVRKLTTEGKKDIRTEVSTGKKTIGETADAAVREMKEMLETSKKDIIEQLDNYILTLEEALKRSSDATFNSILEQSSKKLREIRVAAQNLSNTTTSELLRIQSATEDSVTKLKNYVDNEPQLQELLKSAGDNDKIREALLSITPIAMGESTQAVVGMQSPGIIIPGNDRLVVPANPKVILPEDGIQSMVIPAFDRRIPFKERLNKVLDEKKRREDNGEIFHAVTDEVICCIMEDDWPYLWGPSGCGKSYAIRQIAELVGLEMIDNGKITDKYSLMAYNDPHGRFRATQAFIAVVYGKLLLLDEFDNGNTDTQVLLNELYSASLDVLEKPEKPRYITFAEDMTVPVNPNFRMVSAGNTSGEGENQVFSSRGKSDESVQERMTPIYVSYDNRIEERIFGEFREWYDFFIKFRKACDEYAISEGLDTAPGIGTTRDAAAITRYILDESKSLDEIIRQKFVQTKSPEYLKFLGNAMRKYYGIERANDVEYNGPLSEVKSLTLGKKFIYKCNEVAKNKRA